MTYIDISKPAIDFFMTSSAYGKVSQEKLRKITNNSDTFSIRSLCELETEEKMRSNYGFDENEIDCIKSVLSKYDLNLGMSRASLLTYSNECKKKNNNLLRNATNLEKMVAQKETKEQIKYKEINVRKTDGSTSITKKVDKPIVAPTLKETKNEYSIDEEKFFRFMMAYSKEMNVDATEACEEVDKFLAFINSKKVSKRTDNVLPTKSSNDSSFVEKDGLVHRLRSSKELFFSTIEEFPSFFTSNDLLDAINKKFNILYSLKSIHIHISYMMKAGYVKKVSAKFYPRKDKRAGPSYVYISKNLEDELTYGDYYEWLKSKNPTFKILMKCGKRFTTSNFSQKAAKSKVDSRRALNTLLKRELIVREGCGKYKRIKLPSGPLQFES